MAANDWEESGGNTVVAEPPKGVVDRLVDAVIEDRAPVASVHADTDADAEPDDVERPRGRHRARSQQAGPEDVAQISEYTKRLRQAEDEAAQAAGITRKTGESERVWTLRRRAELAERQRDALKPKAAIPAPPKPAMVARPSAPSAFTEPEPTLEQFADQPDPYMAHVRAVAAWDRKKEAFEARQASEKARAESATKQHDEQFNGWMKQVDDAHVARLDAYVKDHPDFVTKMESAANLQLTPTMYAAVHLHERGPELMAAYVDHPELAEELFLLTHGKPLGDDPLSNPLVAIVQRRLLAKVQAVGSGSAAPPRSASPAPRPPNPLRTAPQTPSPELPGDESSLEDHERVWGPQSRTRRRR